MSTLYTDEINAQVVISLLKQHGIRHVIASPGTTNTALIASMQRDSHFRIYSSVDERSAAYMACGLAHELDEPVVISCTGATASRNYLPGMTEAFYRKLPVLAVTSTQSFAKVGHHVAQVVDRSSIPNDVARISVALPIVKDSEDTWECEIKVNQAILELRRHGGGPAHINLPTIYQKPYTTKELPLYRKITRISADDQFPSLQGKVAVFVGSHRRWTSAQTDALDRFCFAHDAVVFCDHTSSYRGKFQVNFSLVAAQERAGINDFRPDVLIHIGEVTGDYPSLAVAGKDVWRVSEDGQIRDTFRRLRHVFEMSEQRFFEHYANEGNARKTEYLEACRARLARVHASIPELPFSNVWAASQLASQLPPNSVVHFGILNSLRSWNFFELPESVSSASNVGGFGIDGCLSTLIGAALAQPTRLHFAVLGDLAYFYDLNVMGNRHVGPNVRILLINNGKGTEFRQYNHHAAYFGEMADEYISASGHYGNKSPTLVKNFAESLGFTYLSASGKPDFDQAIARFKSAEQFAQPMILELFTDSTDESEALRLIQNIESDPQHTMKRLAKNILGQRVIDAVKSRIGS